MLNSLADIAQLLTKQNVPHRVDEKNSLIEMPTSAPPLQAAAVVRWDTQVPLVQYIVVYAFQAPKERFDAVTAAIARVNHALAMPGFGLNHERGALYMRIVLPRKPDGIGEDELSNGLRAAVSTARDFFTAFKGVVEGHTPDDVLAVATASKSTQTPPTTPQTPPA
jgi:hypothetical protein